MSKFYFDHRDGGELLLDDQGVECRTAENARDLAAIALGEMAKEVLRGAERRELAIEVSDERRKPLFRAALWFEVKTLDG